MKTRFSLSILLAVSLLLAGCAQPVTPETTEPEVTPSVSESPAPEQTLAPSELFSDRDFVTGYEDYVQILLQHDTATGEGRGVSVSGSTVTITKEGSYLLSGILDNGQVIIDTDQKAKVQLILDSVTIHNETSAAVYVAQADKVFITTTTSSINELSSGDSFADTVIDGAIFSRDDLTLNGTGILMISSPAGHGIVSKDSLTITGGYYEINCASHALAGKDDVSIADGTFTLTAGKDGIHAENNDDTTKGLVYIQKGTYKITAEGDGISAGAQLQIEGGEFTITAGGGSVNGEAHNSGGWGGYPGGGFNGGGGPGGGPPRGGFWEPSYTQTDDGTESTSMKGLKATGALTISGGSFTIDSADDGVHSNENLSVSGGEFTIATGDDAFHADDTLTITDGQILVTESYEGLEGHHIAVSGGHITMTAEDDGLNAAGGTDSSGYTGGRDGMFGGGRPGGMGGMGGNSDGSILVSGGTLLITSSGDGMDANGTLEIAGGHVTVCGPTQGDTATLDYDVSGIITGGTFIGTGASGMAQTFSDSTQGVIAVNAGSQAAGTEIRLVDKNGDTVITCAPALGFNVIILSSPNMVKGESYTLYVGELSETFTAS